MNTFKITMLFLLLSRMLFALDEGEIRGRVSDAKTKSPLIGVNIYIPGGNLGASTDSEGRFIINGLPNGAYRLAFEYIGYKTFYETDIIVRQSKPATLNVELYEEILEGEAINVTAGYFVEEEAVQTSVVGLSREEIRRFPGGFEDVVRTVSTLPGVSVNTTGGRNDLLVRGGGPSENLYTINNIEVPNINHFGSQGTGSGSLSFINLDFVEKVTFSTGGMSARYGDKMSSVLALKMAQGRSDRLGFKSLISATQFGLNIEGPVADNGNFIFSARQSYLDLIFKAAGLPFIPVYTDYNFILNMDMSPRDKITFIGLAAVNRVDRDISNEENRVTNAGILDNTQNQWISGANYRRILRDGYFDVTANFNLYQYRFRQIDKAQNTYFRSRADEQELNLKFQIYHSLSKKTGILFGLGSKSFVNDNSTTFADTIFDRSGNRVAIDDLGYQNNLSANATAQKYNVFSEFDWKLNSKFSINSGLRLDVYDFIKKSAYLSPRLSAKYQLNPIHSFKLSGGVYHQSPSYIWVVNPRNKSLKALRNNMAVIGWDMLPREDWRISVEAYAKQYRNLPGGNLAGVTNYLVLNNTGTGFGGRDDDFQSFGYFDLSSTASGNAGGLELLVQKKYSDTPYFGQFSLSLGRSEFTANNGETYKGQSDQPIILNLSAGYILNSKWQFTGKFRYFSGIPFTPVYVPEQNTVNPGQLQNLPDEYLSERLPAGHHLDLRVDRFFYLKNWTFILFLDVQNIYNFEIATRPQYDFWNKKIEKASNIGILPSIGFSIEF